MFDVCGSVLYSGCTAKLLRIVLLYYCVVHAVVECWLCVGIVTLSHNALYCCYVTT